MKNTVSVVIPCFNVEGYLDECVRSVLSQQVPINEVILVDNGSTDSTRTCMQRLSDADPRIRITEESKAGASAARNKGLSLVTGEWVQFLDADDLLRPEKISSQLGLPEASEVAIIAAAYTRLAVDGISRTCLPETEAWKGLFTTRLGITSSNLFRTEAVRSVGGWNTERSSSQEYDLMFRILRAGGRVLIDRNDPDRTIVRERSSGQISSGDPVRRWTNYLELRTTILEYLKSHEPAVWQNDQRFFLQAYFDLLHMVHAFIPETSEHAYRAHIQGVFQPGKGSTYGTGYLVLYRIFGFSIAERIKALFS